MPRLASKSADSKRRVAAKPRAKPKAPRAYTVARPLSAISETGRAYRKSGSALGRTVGGLFGSGDYGAGIGKSLGALVSRITGHGDYQITNAPMVTKNSIVSSGSGIPEFQGPGRVAIRIKHREYLQDVFTHPGIPGAFSRYDYRINPGLYTTFPWLSTVIGTTFQEYRFEGLCFEFRSMSSDALNSTNTALGSVIMATQYDVTDPVFATKQEMANSQFSVTAKPSQNALCAIECERPQTVLSELYIRPFASVPGSDPRFSDLGRFSIATVGGQAANVNLGELWVTYDITVYKPLEQTPCAACPVSQMRLNGVSAALPFGTSQVAQNDPQGIPLNQCGIYFDAGANTVYFPYSTQRGSVFEVTYFVLGISTPTILPGSITLSGHLDQVCDLIANPYSNSTTTELFAVTMKVRVNNLIIATPATPPFIKIVPISLPTGITSAFLSVYQLSGNTFPIPTW